MGNMDLISERDPKSPIAEAYRTLRTNIQFSSFDKKIQTIMVTSSGPGEGKSTTSSNLAVVMAQTGGKTIIIDCDQRKPRLHKLFNLSNEVGLSDLLAGNTGFSAAVHETKIKNLDVLPAGTRPPNPSELLSSNKMSGFVEDLRGEYDCIILDTPPIVAVTDAQLIARYVDGCILVISSGEVEREAAIKAKALLDKVQARIIGAVLNKVEVSEKGYYGYYYHYYYGNDGQKVKKKKTSSSEKSVSA
ncbi:CpsD/CapB family tyrosine-protein kinase [Clostridium lundense]|uniref:CpsD/CapB family tyrosine-protein kinase n=1 Tax=Clostridium lundense TaxID=319475 RepID=UPI000484DC5D|nr:CpsD/CapB family tyrosine-protein kinase [Clostridium lundense]